jgi:hypothetical protein
LTPNTTVTANINTWPYIVCDYCYTTTIGTLHCWASRASSLSLPNVSLQKKKPNSDVITVYRMRIYAVIVFSMTAVQQGNKSVHNCKPAEVHYSDSLHLGIRHRDQLLKIGSRKALAGHKTSRWLSDTLRAEQFLSSWY